MTSAELLAVALRARVYPRGFAWEWGHGPLESVPDRDVEAMLRQHPDRAQYG